MLHKFHVVGANGYRVDKADPFGINSIISG